MVGIAFAASAYQTILQEGPFMKRALNILAALSICASGLTPVFAEEITDSASNSGEQKVTESSSVSADKKMIADADPAAGSKDGKKDPAAKTKSSGSTNWGARLASFTTGVVFGTPIAVVRRTGIEIVQGERDLIGDADTWYKKAAYVFPGFISVGYGAVSGGVGGTLYGVKNAWAGSAHEPFGKEAFSLEDIGN